MNQLLKYSLIVLTLMSLALSSVVHANEPSHDAEECSICIYQPNTDLEINFSEAPLLLVPPVTESNLIWSVAETNLSSVSPFFGRAPPLSA